jgi:antitoxin MazE
MAQVKVARWGEDLAVRLPADVVQAARLSDGEQLKIEARGHQIVIRRIAPHFTLEELFAGNSAERWRGAYANIFDWGSDVGREAVEE